MYLIISAITPVVLFFYLIYNKDTLKEPLGLIFKCFVGGILSVLPAMILSSASESLNVFSSPFWRSFHTAFFSAAISEESSKFLLLYLIVWKNKEFDQHYDGIIYAVAVSLGFAGVENILYVIDGGLPVAILRSILPVPMHGFCGVFMGYFFALAKFSFGNERKWYLIYSILFPIVVHGVFDFLLMYSASGEIPELILLLIAIIFTFFIVYMWKKGLNKIKKHIGRDDNKPV